MLIGLAHVDQLHVARVDQLGNLARRQVGHAAEASGASAARGRVRAGSGAAGGAARSGTDVGSGPRGYQRSSGGRPGCELPDWSRTSLCCLLTPIAVVLLLSGSAAAKPCSADVRADQIEPKAGPALRFGIGPLVQAGQAGGGPLAAVPEQPARTDAALARLRVPGRPFVLRLNRFFWS